MEVGAYGDLSVAGLCRGCRMELGEFCRLRCSRGAAVTLAQVVTMSRSRCHCTMSLLTVCDDILSLPLLSTYHSADTWVSLSVRLFVCHLFALFCCNLLNCR